MIVEGQLQEMAGNYKKNTHTQQHKNINVTIGPHAKAILTIACTL